MGHSHSPIDRRSFCKYLVGGTVAGAGLSSVDPVAALHDQYGTVVDVADEGADTDGSDSVSGLIQELVDNDTLLEFPPGRYYMDEQVRLMDFWNLGLVGEDATLVPADYWEFDAPNYRLFRLGTHYAPGNALRFDSFTVDQTDANTGIRAIEAQVEDDLLVENVDVVGRHDSGTWGPGLFTVTDGDGTGRVHGFRAPDGGQHSSTTPGDIRMGPTGILCNAAHRGTIRFESCVLGGFPDNGLYAAGGAGDVIVEGGHYENSGTASIRLGGNGGTITGTTVRVDRSPWGIGQEGIRLDYGSWYEIRDVTVDIPEPNGEAIRFTDDLGGAKISNSEIAMGSPASVPIQIESQAGPSYLDDVDIEMNGSNNAIQIRGGHGGEMNVHDVTIRGTADGERMRHAIRCERDDVDFRNVSIVQHGGPQRRGLALVGDDPFVYSCWMDTADRPISVWGDDVWIQDCGLTSESFAESVRLFSEARDVRLKSNWMPDGVVNLGATGVLETATSG